MFGTLFIVLVGCNSDTNDNQNLTPQKLSQSSDDIFFPIGEENEMHLEALITGNLILIDQCLFLSTEEPDIDYLVIWPFGFSYTKQGNSLQVLNAEGKVVAEEGVRIGMGGGTHSSMSLPVDMPQDIDCQGPLWNASPEIRILGEDGT